MTGRRQRGIPSLQAGIQPLQNLCTCSQHLSVNLEPKIEQFACEFPNSIDYYAAERILNQLPFATSQSPINPTLCVEIVPNATVRCRLSEENR